MATTTTNSTKNSTKSSSNGVTKKPAAASAKPAKEDKRDKKLPVARRVERSIDRVMKRWERLTKFTSGWSTELDGAMRTITANMKEVHDAFKQVGDDFVPPRKKGGGGGVGKSLAENQLVALTEKGQTYYGDAIDAKDGVGIRVIRVSGKKFIGTLPSGTRVILARAHVKPMLSPDGTPKFHHVEK